MGKLVTIGAALNTLDLSRILANVDATYPKGHPLRNAALSYVINSHPNEPYTAFVQNFMDPPGQVLTADQVTAAFGANPPDLLAPPPIQTRKPIDRLPPPLRRPDPIGDPPPDPDPLPDHPAAEQPAPTNTMLLLLAGAVVLFSMKGRKL